MDGGGCIHMHHKFVVCDFNGSKPVVFTSSSNMAAGGEQGNGDNLIEIRDPKVVIAYAVQAVSIFDHYGFRNRMKTAKTKPAVRELLPMQPGDVPETCADTADLERAVGFRPRTPIGEGVRRFVDWFLQFRQK